jgi:hypothetical protein
MYPSFTFLIDMEFPDFDLPPEVEALPTAELQLLALLYMGHKGVLPSAPIMHSILDNYETSQKNG